MHDTLIIGGGAIGLSLAYELACRGERVAVVERGELGQESSWAGAGIVPPGVVRAIDSPPIQLAAHAHRLHAEWAERLRSETGIDNGFRRCGALYLAVDAESRKHLEAEIAPLRAQGVECRAANAEMVARVEPALADACSRDRIVAAYHLPDEAQVRNPRHLRALIAACRKRGVEFTVQEAVEKLIVRDGAVREVVVRGGSLTAGKYCLAGGAWTAGLAEQVGLRLGVRPIRGQMVLLRSALPVVRGIVYAGRKYLVARDDGRVLVGSTEEDVGFDKSTTDVAIRELLDFAYSLTPQLRAAEVERTWAGLRPFSADGLPYLGSSATVSNLFVAAGHYRWGLALSAATAVVVAQAILGEPTLVDLAPFRLERGSPI